jgi:hypothetical protein
VEILIQNLIFTGWKPPFAEKICSAPQSLFTLIARTILMVKSEMKTKDVVWLRLRGYHVVPLKPECNKLTGEVQRAIQEGASVYPDLAHPDFYHVLLEGAWAYIHVYRDERAVYLVAQSRLQLNSLEYFNGTAGSEYSEWRTRLLDAGQAAT